MNTCYSSWQLNLLFFILNFLVPSDVSSFNKHHFRIILDVQKNFEDDIRVPVFYTHFLLLVTSCISMVYFFIINDPVFIQYYYLKSIHFSDFLVVCLMSFFPCSVIPSNIPHNILMAHLLRLLLAVIVSWFSLFVMTLRDLRNTCQIFWVYWHLMMIFYQHD